MKTPRPTNLPMKIFIYLAVVIANLMLALAGFANNPGGFTTLVTAPVTTGTETFNGHTDNYLDNGILHVLIENNGSVDSIKYLKPGSAGTPEANGTETVSQSGVNFGNHTAIYYYWYPDGNGDATYLNKTVNSTNIDLAYLRTYNPASDQVVADVELHYALGKGNCGLYCYIIVRHPANYAVYTNNLNISFMQCIWPTAHDNTNFLCENQYLDNYTKYGLFINGVQQPRNGLQPDFWDDYHTTNVAGMPKEILQYTTGVFAGCTNGKYSFTLDYPKFSTFGMASDTNRLGLWYVSGGHEYQNNGVRIRRRHRWPAAIRAAHRALQQHRPDGEYQLKLEQNLRAVAAVFQQPIQRRGVLGGFAKSGAGGKVRVAVCVADQCRVSSEKSACRRQRQIRGRRLAAPAGECGGRVGGPGGNGCWSGKRPQ